MSVDPNAFVITPILVEEPWSEMLLSRVGAENIVNTPPNIRSMEYTGIADNPSNRIYFPPGRYNISAPHNAAVYEAYDQQFRASIAAMSVNSNTTLTGTFNLPREALDENFESKYQKEVIKKKELDKQISNWVKENLQINVSVSTTQTHLEVTTTLSNKVTGEEISQDVDQIELEDL